MRRNARDWKFLLLNTFIVPPVVLLTKALVWSYRIDAESVAVAQELARRKHPILIATYHGQYFALVKFARISHREGRNICVMTSPSQDGRVLDALLIGLGMTVVKGSSKSKAVAGSRALIDMVIKGEMGLLAVDGPKGPIGVPKPGFLTIAPAAGAQVVCVTTSASRYLVIKSWDKPFLPLPFARLRMRITDFVMAPEGMETREASLLRMQQQLYDDAKALNSPTLQFLAPAEKVLI